MVTHMTHTSADGSVLDGRCGDRSRTFQLVETPQHVRKSGPQTHYFVTLFQHLLLQVRYSLPDRLIFSLDHVIPSVDDSADGVPWRLHGDFVVFSSSNTEASRIHIVLLYTPLNTLTSFTRKDILVSLSLLTTRSMSTCTNSYPLRTLNWIS